MDINEIDANFDDLSDSMKEDIWDILFPFLKEGQAEAESGESTPEKDIEPWNVEHVIKSRPRGSMRFLSM